MNPPRPPWTERRAADNSVGGLLRRTPSDLAPAARLTLLELPGSAERDTQSCRLVVLATSRSTRRPQGRSTAGRRTDNGQETAPADRVSRASQCASFRSSDHTAAIAQRMPERMPHEITHNVNSKKNTPNVDDVVDTSTLTSTWHQKSERATVPTWPFQWIGGPAGLDPRRQIWLI